MMQAIITSSDIILIDIVVVVVVVMILITNRLCIAFDARNINATLFLLRICLDVLLRSCLVHIFIKIVFCFILVLPLSNLHLLLLSL